MKKLCVFFIVFSFVTFLFFSCTDHGLEDLTDPIEEIDLVTYTVNVKPIIDNNCIFCHNNPPISGAPMPLLTYDNVKNAILTRDLIARINSNDPAFLMPAGGPKLPQNLIDIIEQWQTDGLLE